MRQALEGDSLRFAHARIQTLFVRDDLRGRKRFGKLHREIDFAAGRPSFDAASTNDRVLADDFQFRPQDRHVPGGVEQVENKMTAVTLGKVYWWMPARSVALISARML